MSAHLRRVWGRLATATLATDLERLRPQLAQAAQKVVDAWEQDEEGMDEVYGGGGICDDVAQAMASVIPWDTHDGGQDGDDHAFLVVVRGEEVAMVDIHPSSYETGGGYNWRKIPDAKIRPDEVIIEMLDIPASEFEDEF